MSREVKIVAYGTATADAERLIDNYLNDKLTNGRVNIYSVDSKVTQLNREVSTLKARIAELEAEEE